MGSPRSVLACAKAFHDVGERLVSRFPTQGGHQRGIEDEFAPVVASAVNVGFALELYLKATSMWSGGMPLATHDLLKLWMDLPEVIRSHIRMLYEDSLAARGPGHEGPISIVYSVASQPVFVLPATLTVGDLSVENLLERAKALFITFRYIFETDTDERGSQRDYTYEHVPLLWLCGSLRRYNDGVLAAALALIADSTQ